MVLEMRNKIYRGLAIAGIIAFVLLQINIHFFGDKWGTETEAQKEDTTANDRVQAYVVRVIDGDTFIVNCEGVEHRVRLIGIDTPESVANDQYLESVGKENTTEGKEAFEFVKSLIEDKTVFLEFDVSREDKYGRVLAYAYLEDGRMLQDVLLNSGYAQIATYPPNVKYVDHFLEVVNQNMEK